MTQPRRNRRQTATICAIVTGLLLAAWWQVESHTAPMPPPIFERAALEPPSQSTNAAVRADAADATRAAPATAGTQPPRAASQAFAAVQLRCSGPLPARVRFVVADEAGNEIAEEGRPCEGPEIAAELPVPEEQWLRIGAVTVDQDGREAAVPGVRTRLGAGERQVIELTSRGVATTLRLLGPTARLRPHLQLLLQRVPIDTARDRRPLAVRLGATGTVRCHLPDEPIRASVLTADGMPVLLANGTITELTQRGGEIELAPLEPLLGLCVQQRGATTPSTLSFGKLPAQPAPTMVHVTRRGNGVRAAFVFGITGELGPFRVPIQNVHADADLWLIAPRPEHRLGRLLVTLGERSEPSTRPDLLAEPLGGGAAHKLAHEQDGLRAALEPGDYRLHWQLGSGRGPVAADFVRLAPGDLTTLHLQPPAQQRWSVSVQVPPECTDAVFLRIGSFHALGGSRDGELPIDLLEPLRVGDRGELIVFGLKQTFPATVVAVDPAAQRAQVETALAAAAWTRLAAVPMAGGRCDIRLQQAAGSLSELPAMLGPGRNVPLLPGQQRAGCVVETIDGEDQLVRWFTVAAGARELVLHGNGRWAQVTIERPFAQALVHLSGPPGMDAVRLRSLVGRGPHRLFVADGTRQVHVDLEPLGRHTFDPNLAEFVVR